MKKSKLILILLFLGVLLSYLYTETYWVETKEVVIESRDIPPEFDGKRIVFITDIHAGPDFSPERVDGVVEKVNSLEPDLILLGGDYIDREYEYVSPVFDSMEKLSAPMGVYGVLGNNDPQYLTLKTFDESSLNYIGNTGEWIQINDSRIRVAGVGDFNNGQQLIDRALGDAAAEDFVILLSHNPDYFPELDHSMVDLVLAGHTHGGQVTFFGLWAPVMRTIYGQKYITGVIEENKSTMIVSNGLGTVILPIRFFAKPQIHVIELKSVN